MQTAHEQDLDPQRPTTEPRPERAVVRNVLAGERFEFPVRASQGPDEPLVFDFYLASQGGIPEAHIHGSQREVFRCVRGAMRVTVDGQSRELRAGETIEIPAGTSHSFVNPHEGECHCEVEYHPAGRNREWLELLAAYVERHGKPAGALDIAPFIGDVDIYLAGMPLSVQRALFRGLAGLANLLGRREKMLAMATEVYGRPFTW